MKHTSDAPVITGTYRASGRGYGFVIPDDPLPGGDLFIPPRQTGGAWHNDRVTAQVGHPDDDGRTAGRVLSVTERANRIVTGTLKKLGRDLCLLPDSDRLPAVIRVAGSPKGARSGDKAAVGILSFGGREGTPMGTLRDTFGPAGTRESAVAAILCQNEIDVDFPPAVLIEADSAPDTVPPDALAGRLDLRSETVITIDGASAKDLDDAVSLTRDEQGRLVLGVHIADVSHYVASGSALDREAYERGTSVYFADRVVPMLPPALSNGICSLNPHVDRLTLSCLMTLDSDDTVVAHSIAKSVIRSAERMTYEDCNLLLSGGDKALEERYCAILPLLQALDAIAQQQAKRRRSRGALDLAGSEVAIQCDSSGRPISVTLREQGRAEALIEQCMLTANETVAEHLCTLHKPAVYRVHEKPAGAKIESLRLMLASLGYDIREADHGSLQRVLNAARGTPEELAVNTILLRSMMKARYDANNLGHFGLAAEYYCHFTSPIRRYPDLVVHRFLSQLLAGPLTASAEKKARAFAEQAARQSSQRELAAQTAEREIEKRYLAEYMSGHIGETFPGVVSGASRAGLFVSLPVGIEGFLPAEALPDDHFVYEEQRLRLVGERTGLVYTIGMPMTVLCVAADPATGRIDLAPEGAPPVPIRTDAREPLHGKHTSTRAPQRKGKRAMHVPRRRRK